MDGLIFWEKSKNPFWGKTLEISPKARTFLSKNKNKLALSVFDPSCKISKKFYESLLRKTDNWPPDICTDLLT